MVSHLPDQKQIEKIIKLNLEQEEREIEETKTALAKSLARQIECHNITKYPIVIRLELYGDIQYLAWRRLEKEIVESKIWGASYLVDETVIHKQEWLVTITINEK